LEDSRGANRIPGIRTVLANVTCRTRLEAAVAANTAMEILLEQALISSRGGIVVWVEQIIVEVFAGHR